MTRAAEARTQAVSPLLIDDTLSSLLYTHDRFNGPDEDLAIADHVTMGGLELLSFFVARKGIFSLPPGLFSPWNFDDRRANLSNKKYLFRR
jgi:hypothetical protein